MSEGINVLDDFDPPPVIPARRKRKRVEALPSEAMVPLEAAGIKLSDFYAHMPSHSYLFVPTRELWPGSSVNGRLPSIQAGNTKLRPSDWLDRNRPIEQMTWHPAESMLIHDRVMQVSGWATHEGASVFNLYRAPEAIDGDPTLAGPWIEHLKRIYPGEAEHITHWLAHRIQFPGDKCNHALVLGGSQGIGKDTILEPVKAGVGPWNWQDVAPAQMLGRFNGWAKAVVVRVNEARDLGDVDRFAFYDHSKTYIAAPPDVIRVDEKHLREHYVANVCGVIITTNHKTDGLYDMAPATHTVWTGERDVSDFKTQTLAKLSEAPSLDLVLEGAEYTFGAFSEAAETFSVATYGRMVRFTRQSLTNDDLSSLSTIPNSQGAAARRLEADMTYGKLIGNPSMSDGKALFHADHGNLVTAAALSVASLGAARAAMRKQRGTNGLDFIDPQPRFLIVPVALETTAEALLASMVDPSKQNDATNPAWIRGLTLVADPRLDADSATAWYLAAAPSQIEGIVRAYIAGEARPFLDTKDGWMVDSTDYKVRLDIGVGVIDYRGLLKNPGL